MFLTSPLVHRLPHSSLSLCPVWEGRSFPLLATSRQWQSKEGSSRGARAVMGFPNLCSKWQPPSHLFGRVFEAPEKIVAPRRPSIGLRPQPYCWQSQDSESQDLPAPVLIPLTTVAPSALCPLPQAHPQGWRGLCCRRDSSGLWPSRQALLGLPAAGGRLRP